MKTLVLVLCGLCIGVSGNPLPEPNPEPNPEALAEAHPEALPEALAEADPQGFSRHRHNAPVYLRLGNNNGPSKMITELQFGQQSRGGAAPARAAPAASVRSAAVDSVAAESFAAPEERTDRWRPTQQSQQSNFNNGHSPVFLRLSNEEGAAQMFTELQLGHGMDDLSQFPLPSPLEYENENALPAEPVTERSLPRRQLTRPVTERRTRTRPEVPDDFIDTPSSQNIISNPEPEPIEDNQIVQRSLSQESINAMKKEMEASQNLSPLQEYRITYVPMVTLVTRQLGAGGSGLPTQPLPSPGAIEGVPVMFPTNLALPSIPGVSNRMPIPMPPTFQVPMNGDASPFAFADAAASDEVSRSSASSEGLRTDLLSASGENIVLSMDELIRRINNPQDMASLRALARNFPQVVLSPTQGRRL